MRCAIHLDWDGCFNARDLGGIRTSDGRAIRRGALVRADALDQLSAPGWQAVLAHGVRTILDLRNDDEKRPDASPRPDEILTLHLPLDQIEDREFWDAWTSGWQFGTPLYYGPHLARFPERSAAVIAAIAHADPRGVVVHCGIGRDRTGLVTMLLLTLLGVAAEDIATDYELSEQRLPPLFARRAEPDQGPLIRAFLEQRGTSTRATIMDTLEALQVEGWMRAGGLRDADVAALRARLLG